MKTAEQDLLDLLDLAWTRLSVRMRGLADDEWSWHPIDDDTKVSIRWRIDHLTEMLGARRNWVWLGSTPSNPAHTAAASSASEAIEALSAAYVDLRTLIGGAAVQLETEIGSAAGPFADATRRSFVLHVADELIHHAAEAALLRDLYSGGAFR